MYTFGINDEEFIRGKVPMIYLTKKKKKKKK
jgi:hypothetical protein